MILITNLKMPVLCGVTIHITPQGRVFNEDTGCDIGKAIELEEAEFVSRNAVKDTLCHMCEYCTSCEEDYVCEPLMHINDIPTIIPASEEE